MNITTINEKLILKINKNHLLCPRSNELLVKPRVLKDGWSYSASTLSSLEISTTYENKKLQTILDEINTKYGNYIPNNYFIIDINIWDLSDYIGVVFDNVYIIDPGLSYNLDSLQNLETNPVTRAPLSPETFIKDHVLNNIVKDNKILKLYKLIDLINDLLNNSNFSINVDVDQYVELVEQMNTSINNILKNIKIPLNSTQHSQTGGMNMNSLLSQHDRNVRQNIVRQTIRHNARPAVVHNEEANRDFIIAQLSPFTILLNNSPNALTNLTSHINFNDSLRNIVHSISRGRWWEYYFPYVNTRNTILAYIYRHIPSLQTTNTNMREQTQTNIGWFQHERDNQDEYDLARVLAASFNPTPRETSNNTSENKKLFTNLNTILKDLQDLTIDINTYLDIDITIRDLNIDIEGIPIGIEDIPIIIEKLTSLHHYLINITINKINNTK